MMIKKPAFLVGSGSETPKAKSPTWRAMAHISGLLLSDPELL